MNSAIRGHRRPGVFRAAVETLSSCENTWGMMQDKFRLQDGARPLVINMEGRVIVGK